MHKSTTKMINQPALQTSSGLIWIVMGGLFAAVVVTMFIFMTINFSGVAQAIAISSIVTVILIYSILVVARFAVAPGPVRLRVLGGCMLTMAAYSLVATLLITWTQRGLA